MKYKALFFGIGVATLALAVGCSEAKEAPTSSVSGAAVSVPSQKAGSEKIVLAQAVGASGAAGSGGASGRVIFDGEQPKLKKVNMAADPVCQGLHADVVRSETVLVNANGTLRNVFVYVKEGLKGKTSPAPSDKVILNQEGCVYKPHVLGVQVGQPIEIINSDGTLHNVHALGKANPEFNYGMPFQGMALPAQFDAPEIMVKFKCDVHPWMNAYVGVLEHSHFDVTGEDGAFDLGALEPGEYTLEAWHEYYGTQTQKITLPASGEISFTFSHEAGA